jgi:hypothetical protein
MSKQITKEIRYQIHEPEKLPLNNGTNRAVERVAGECGRTIWSGYLVSPSIPLPR